MTLLTKTLAAALVGVVSLVAVRGFAAEPDEAPAPPMRPAAPVDPDRDPAPAPAPARPGVPRPGLGNSIIIENGNGRSMTVIENNRNGIGNRLIVIDGQVIEDSRVLPLPGPAVAPAPLPRFGGLRFGEVRFYSPWHEAMLYWDARTQRWYRYDAVERRYVPAEWDL